MKILITNAVALNGGDAAMLYGLVRGLRRRLGEAIEVIVLSSQAEISARYHPEFVFREPLSRVVLRAARSPRTRIGCELERGGAAPRQARPLPPRPNTLRDRG
ncbi:MAG TPA: hypothetical protein VMN78_01340 [Longimicrobiales bacterium]|nr:hypothetical protein [Longimicrobiales bacterium]